MRDLVILFIHLLTTAARLAGRGGLRSVVAESVLLKHQLLILNRSRQRAPPLRLSDRLVAGWCALLMRPSRLIRSAIVLNFRPLFMPLPSPVGIRDADRPEQVPQPPGDHTEYGDLEFVAPECLPTVREYLVPGWSVGGLGCNELPTP